MKTINKKQSKYSLPVIIFLFIMLTIPFFMGCEKEQIAYEPKGSITGQVKDADTEEPIGSVTITTNPASGAILTDNEGNFEVSGVQAGEVTVTAKKTGYDSESLNVMVEDDETTEVNFLMEVDMDAKSLEFSNPTPEDESEDTENDVTLKWNIKVKSNSTDSIYYDVYLFSNQLEKTKIAAEITDTATTAENLRFNTTYFWQVVGKDENKEELEKSDVWSFKTRSFPHQDIIYSKRVNGSFEIHTADTLLDNQTIVQITELTISNEMFPRVSPSGEKILFSSNKDVGFHLYVANKDGAEMSRAVNHELGGYHYRGGGYAWGSSDAYFFFTNYDKMYKVNLNIDNVKQIATAPEGRNFRGMDWNANTGKIVVQTIGENINESEIYIMNDDGSDTSLIVPNYPGRVDSPSFSPDGRKVLFTRDVEGFENEQGRMLDSRVMIYDLVGDSIMDISRDLKPDGTNDVQPRFSNTGAEVLFVNTPNTLNAGKSIWIMDSDGTNRYEVINEGEMPSWFN